MLPSVKCHGIVVRYANYKEYDRMLTVLSPELGRVEVIARGCRRQKSRLAVVGQPFVCGEFTLSVSGERRSVTGFEMQDSFYPLREDLDRLSYAAYLSVMAAEAVQSGQNAKEEYRLLLQALSFLAYSDVPVQNIALIFTVRLLTLIGYRIETERCVRCGAVPGPEGEIAFDAENGGILCPHCARIAAGAIPASRGTLSTIALIGKTDPGRMQTLRISPSIRGELIGMLRKFTAKRMHRVDRIARFIEQMEQGSMKMPEISERY